MAESVVIETNTEAATEAATDPFDQLLAALGALEQALVRWDRDGISTQGTAVRLATDQTRLAVAAGEQAAPGRLRAILALGQRCQRLADDGARLAGSVVRVGALTYAPASTDRKESEARETGMVPERARGGGTHGAV